MCAAESFVLPVLSGVSPVMEWAVEFHEQAFEMQPVVVAAVVPDSAWMEEERAQQVGLGAFLSGNSLDYAWVLAALWLRVGVNCAVTSEPHGYQHAAKAAPYLLPLRVSVVRAVPRSPPTAQEYPSQWCACGHLW